MPDYDPSPFPDIPSAQGAWAPDHIANDYTGYGLTIDYGTDRHVLQGPVAGPEGAACEMIAVAAPTGHVTVAWAATRKGAWPAAPKAEPPAGGAFVLKTKVVSPSPPMLDADGLTRIYTLQGRYVYGLTLPLERLRSSYPAGAFPFDSTPYSAYVVDAATFRTTIFGFDQ